MTWLKKNALIIFLILLGVILRFYVGSKTGISFDFDQERDATRVMQIVWEFKPALVGPRVANDSGFFLGPYHYYFLLPFYLATGGHPYAGVLAAIFVASITTYLYYFVGRKLLGERVGQLAALMSIFLVDLNSWNPMYFSLLTLLFISLVFDVCIKSKNHLWLAALCGLAVNLHLAFGLMSVVSLLVLIFVKKLPLKKYLLMMLAYLVWFTPLVIFDLRHSGIIRQSILRFVSDSSEGIGSNVWEKLSRSLEMVPMFDSWLSVLTKIIFVFGLILMLGKLWRMSKTLFISILLMLILPVITLSFYRGNLPEYYFGMIVAFIPLSFGLLLSKSIYIGLISISLWGFYYIDFKTWQVVNIPLLALLFNRNFKLAISIAVSGALLLLPFIGTSVGSTFVFEPLWFIRSMFASPDRVDWPYLALTYQNFLQSGNLLKATLISLFGGIVYIFGNLSVRLVFSFSKQKDRLLTSIIFFGMLIPLVFTQVANPWNTIQFTYYSIFFSGLLASMFLGFYSSSLGKTILVVIILIISSITSIRTLRDYTPTIPSSRVSYNELYALKYLESQPKGLVVSGPFEERLTASLTWPKPLYGYVTSSYISAMTGHTEFLSDQINLDITSIEYQEKFKELWRFFNTQDEQWQASFLKKYQINYLYETASLRVKNRPQTCLSPLFESPEITISHVTCL